MNPSPGTPHAKCKLASEVATRCLPIWLRVSIWLIPIRGAESLKYGLWLSQLIAINYNGPQNIGDTSLGYRNSLGLNQAVAVQGLFVVPNVIDPNESVLAPPICVHTGSPRFQLVGAFGHTNSPRPTRVLEGSECPTTKRHWD